MTQLQSARNREITEEMKKVASVEGCTPEHIMDLVSRGLVVIPVNKNHKNVKPVGIGKGLKVKVNANIGTSSLSSDLENELKKVDVSREAGADTIMDLSTGGDLRAIRRAVLARSDMPVGTVPIYEAVVKLGNPVDLTIENYLDVFERQAREGIDFATVHAGVTMNAIPLLGDRLMGVVSRGGSFLIRWMKKHNEENPLYTNFDEILKIAREYDVTMSLGDGLRPGCIHDATDKAQLHELEILGELSKRCFDAGVQVMIEGPGHIPLNQIEKNVRLAKEYCNNAPFYVLGPLPTDIAPGYDHIVCAIGGALACYHGADFLCYVTPKEHVGLPNIEDVREGIIASKIAAHVADVARGNFSSMERDRGMSIARRNVKWDDMTEFTIDPKRFAELRLEECKINPKDNDYCSMCGEFCAIKVYKDE
ncbi:MAG: phosphomethylpyrimidine synthase ThiC [Candidatus Thermoplasmatota archaeon]|nr:phosphomethylpyrimidine synthase ThiC [Candidatus Thermoplasmatota archaeon]